MLRAHTTRIPSLRAFARETSTFCPYCDVCVVGVRCNKNQEKNKELPCARSPHFVPLVPLVIPCHLHGFSHHPQSTPHRSQPMGNNNSTPRISPSLYEINTRVYLNELSQQLGKKVHVLQRVLGTLLHNC